VGLVARGDRILLLSAAGEIEPGEPMPVNAIARIASIQKPITATAVLMLQERGQLDLREPVTRWFPEFGQRVVTPAATPFPPCALPRCSTCSPMKPD
jgi:CubicO group peptidase (beta-lactamase class C family)